MSFFSSLSLHRRLVSTFHVQTLGKENLQLRRPDRTTGYSPESSRTVRVHTCTTSYTYYDLPLLSEGKGAKSVHTMSNKIDIHGAAGEGNLAEVKAFLKAGGIIDKRDADRWTPLMLSVREGHLEVARQLLRSGAALEAKDGDKWTAMHVAAANGHPQCCQLLLDRGGNPRAADENKRTPLHWASRYTLAADPQKHRQSLYFY